MTRSDTAPQSLDSFNCRRTLTVGENTYEYFSLPEAEKSGLEGISRLPFSLKVLLENLLRFEDGRSVTADDIRAIRDWLTEHRSSHEIAYRPARVLMQDFTGVPAVVDLAAMRDAMAQLGGDPTKINPLVPVDLVIDHSVMVDEYGNPKAFAANVEHEYERNKERYGFLRWGAEAFDNFRVVPPGTGICHQVNLEYLGKTVWVKETGHNGSKVLQAYPDTLVGTDSHTTMINGLSVLGWGVGGIEAEAAMLGQPISMVIPEVIGVRFHGALNEGVTATDLVLTVTEMLRKKGVVGKFVEYSGDGLDHLSLEDQATLGNMSPEYGATCGFFPVDNDTLKYLRATGREEDHIALVEAYAKAQGMWRETGTQTPEFTDVLDLDLSTVEPSLAGPRRPQDRVPLSHAHTAFRSAVAEIRGVTDDGPCADMDEEGAGSFPTFNHSAPVEGANYTLSDGDVVIAAITSCTNTSNPNVLIGAGLLARNAREKGIHTKPWVKTSFAPGSQVVTDYLEKAGLQDDLDAMGFNLVGYGCTTCIGNSGPLDEPISKAIHENDLIASAVLSGNRNFEGRINPDVRANYLASPPLVVAYALAGSLNVNISAEPIDKNDAGEPVYLKDIWPSTKEIAEIVRTTITPEMFKTRYADVFKGDEHWQALSAAEISVTYDWSDESTYVQRPPFFDDMAAEPKPVTDIEGARILGLFADSITTDHISPAGAIPRSSPAGQYLIGSGVEQRDFNSFGARRGNHEVMMRGTFGNIRIKNQMVPGVEGGYTIHYPSGEQLAIYDAAMRYVEDGVPLVIFAGKEYGTGSSRDWAAKGTRLLGVKAVIAESFERIHRSNLIGMGVLPLVFDSGQTWEGAGITGTESVSIRGLDNLKPGAKLTAKVTFEDGTVKELPLICRIDTEDEMTYYRNGGILHYVLRRLAA